MRKRHQNNLVSLKDQIILAYTEKKHSIRNIERDFGIPHQTLKDFLVKNNIPIRSRAEAARMILGTGTENISGNYWAQLKFQAIRRNIPFTLSIEHVQDLFEKQKGLCVLSGVPLVSGYKVRNHRNKVTASLDRINSNLGYIPGNIQWVHKNVNYMKRNMSDSEFIDWCKIISAYN